MAQRFGRISTKDWHKEILRKKRKKSYQKIQGYYMFPTTHDISVKNLNESIIEIRKILASGSKILIVTKPHLYCVQKICAEFVELKDQILFRFTIGSADDKVLKFWEPFAPKFAERLASLKWAFKKGFQTSVSSEPFLDNRIVDVVDQVHPFVTDTIWIGKANRLKGRLSVNGYKGKKYEDAVDQLAEWPSEDNIMEIYRKYKDDPKIEWKESIKKVVDKRLERAG